MKLNLTVIITILVLVLLFITLVFCFNKKERYILPSESSEVSKYKIFKEFMTITDLNQLQLINKETRQIVLSLIKQLFGYNSFSELRNLNIFSLYTSDKTSLKDLELFYYLLSLLKPKVLRKSKTLYQTFNPDLNYFVLSDFSNLDMAIERRSNTLLQLPQGKDLIARLYNIPPFNSPVRQFSITIRVNTNLELVTKLIELTTVIKNPNLATVYLVQDGLNFVFNLNVNNFDRMDINNFNLNIYFNEDEVQEEDEMEVEEKEEEPAFEFPFEWYISQLIYSIRSGNPRIFARLLREIGDKTLKRQLEEIIGYFTSPNYSKFQQIFEDEARYIIRRQPKLFTKEKIEELSSRLEQLQLLDAFEPQNQGEFNIPQIIIPQNQIILEAEDMMDNAFNIAPIPQA